MGAPAKNPESMKGNGLFLMRNDIAPNGTGRERNLFSQIYDASMKLQIVAMFVCHQGQTGITSHH